MAVQNFVAGAAVYQGISRFLTGRCFCYHFRFFVSLCRNFLLGFQDLIADLTMTSLSFSCCFTGGFYGLINDFFMSKRWRFFLNSQYFTADCTMASFGFSWFFTGCCYCLIGYFLMLDHRKFFCSGFLAVCTGVALLTFFGTGCFFDNFSCFPVMTGCRDYFLLF